LYDNAACHFLQETNDVMLRYVILWHELGHQATNRNAEGEAMTNRTWEKKFRTWRLFAGRLCRAPRGVITQRIVAVIKQADRYWRCVAGVCVCVCVCVWAANKCDAVYRVTC